MTHTRVYMWAAGVFGFWAGWMARQLVATYRTMRHYRGQR